MPLPDFDTLEEIPEAKPELQATLEPPDRSLWQQFRTSDVGRKLFGPTDVERESMAGGISGSQLGLLEIPQSMLKMTSAGVPWIAEPVRQATEKAYEFPGAAQFAAQQILGPVGAMVPESVTKGVARGAREIALGTPLAPFGAGALNKAALAVFGGEYLKDLPDKYSEFKKALSENRLSDAATIATETVGGGALLAFGAKHALEAKPSPMEVPQGIGKPPIVMTEPAVEVPSEVTPIEPRLLEAPKPEPSTTGEPNAPNEVRVETGVPGEREAGSPLREAGEASRGDSLQRPAEPGEPRAPSEAEQAPNQVALADFEKRLVARESGPITTEQSNAIGMGLSTLADLERMAKLRESIKATSREMMAKGDKEALPVGGRVQFPREAIEAATNSGSTVEGAGGGRVKLGERPLDWRKNPEVAQWLIDNAGRTGMNVSDIVPPGLDEVAKMTGPEYFDAAQSPRMSQRGRMSPQQAAEDAVKDNPDIGAWQKARSETKAELARVQKEIQENPESLPTRQKELMGLTQKNQFFGEGLDILEGRKTPEPTPATAAQEPRTVTEWTESTREPELATQLSAGIPDPVATYRAAVKLAKQTGQALAPAAKEAVGFSKKLGGEIVNGPKMDDFKSALLNWSAKLQRSYHEAANAAASIRKSVPDESKRQGIVNWIQADGDAAVLRQRANATTDPKLKKGYEAALSLTPEEIAVARNVKRTFDDLAQRAQRYGILKTFKDNYVTQIWDLNKGPVGGSTRTLRDKFRFAKASSFPNYFEGEQAGFKPKTKDIAKILPLYIHEMNNVIAARQLVEQMSGGDAKDGRPLLAPKGMGISVNDAGGTATLVMPKVPKEGFEDYKVIENQPAFNDWIWAGKDPESGNPVFLKADLAVHPDYYRHLKNVLGRSAVRDWYSSTGTAMGAVPKALARWFDTANSEAKRTMLGFFAPFHQVQEGTHAVGHRVNPFRASESGLIQRALPNLPEALKMPKIDLTKNPEQVDAAQHGLMLAPDRTSANQFMEGFRHSGLISRIKGIGPLADHYSEYLFGEYIPGLKFLTYEAMRKRNMDVFKKEMASGEVSQDDVKLLSAIQANAAYGHLNYTLIGRSPTLQHWMQIGLLAPDFLEARTKFAGQAITGLGGAKAGREQLIALGALALAQGVMAYTVAKLTGGDWDPLRPFEMIHGDRRYTMRSVPEDLSAFIHDSRQFIHNRLSLIGKGGLQYTTGVDWRGQKVTPWDTTKELAKYPVPLTLKGIAGEIHPAFSGNTPLAWWEQLLGSVGLKISRYSPVADMFQAAHDFKKKSGVARWVQEADRDEKTVNAPSDYKPLREALILNDNAKVREAYNKLLETRKPDVIEKAMRPWTEGTTTGVRERHMKPFTGSRTAEKAFIKDMSPRERKVYDKAIEERRMLYQRFKSLKASNAEQKKVAPEGELQLVE